MGIFNEHSSPSNSAANTGTVGRPGIGFKLTDTGDYDMQNKKLVNVKSGTDSNDAANKSQLDSSTILLQGSRAGDVVNDKAVIYSNTGAVHARSLYLLDDPQDGNRNEVRLETPHQSYGNIHLNIPDLHNFDGYGGRPKSEVMVTSVEQTVTGKKVFENIEVHDPTSNNQATNKHYVDHNFLNRITGGQIGGDLDMRGNTIKYLKLDNTESAAARVAELNLKLNRSGDKMDGDINMNNNFIQNIATPTSSHQGVNKGYCDYNFLNRQKGGVIMGPLSMNRNDLIGIPDTPKYGYSAVNKNYVDGEIGKIASVDTTQLIKKDGSVPMAADLDMGTHKISNVVNPEFDTDVVNKQYLKNKLIESHLQPSGPSNIFHFLMNDTSKFSSIREIIIGSFSDVEKVAHRLNKKALSILLQNDLQTVSYSARLGLDMTSLSVGDYTLVMEFYWPEKFNIYTYADSTPTNIVDEQNIKNFSNYQKLYLQFTKKNTNSPNNLIMEIRGELSTSNQQTGYLIFYGTKGTHYSITNDFYDQYIMSDIFIYNENMKMQTKIDMNNNKIIKLSNGTDPDDAINKGQFDTLKNKFDSHQFYIKNHLYMSIFSYRFYDLKEPIKFNYTLPNVSGIEPGLSILSSGQGHLSINELDPISGLKFNHSIRIIIDLGYTINQVAPYTIMLSLTLKDDITIYFTDDHSTKYYPVYKIDQTMLLLMIITSDGIMQHKSYSSQFNDTQVMLWIHFNPASNRYRISLANHAVADFISTPPSSFSTNKLRINPGNNLINKICYQNQYISADLHYTQILFEEKKNGSHFE